MGDKVLAIDEAQGGDEVQGDLLFAQLVGACDIFLRLYGDDGGLYAQIAGLVDDLALLGEGMIAFYELDLEVTVEGVAPATVNASASTISMHDWNR